MEGDAEGEGENTVGGVEEVGAAAGRVENPSGDGAGQQHQQQHQQGQQRQQGLPLLLHENDDDNDEEEAMDTEEQNEQVDTSDGSSSDSQQALAVDVAESQDGQAASQGLLSPGSPRLRRTLSAGTTGGNGVVVAGGGGGTEFNGKITVGDDYQCVIPTKHAPDKEDEMTRIGTLRWCPVQAATATAATARETPEEGEGQEGAQGVKRCDTVVGFIAAAKLVHPKMHVDELLASLHSHGYNAAHALDTLQGSDYRQAGACGGSAQHVLDIESLDKWEDDDKAEFTAAVFKHGKDFTKIHRRLPSRSVPQLILYYYLRWKGTRTFFEWEEKTCRQGDRPNAEVTQDECAACNTGGGLLCCEGCPQAFHFACCNPPVSVLSLTGKAWYCPKCTISRIRWGQQVAPCSDNSRIDEAPSGPRGRIRLMNDTKMMPPAAVMQYKSVSCNPRCKHCTHLLADSLAGAGSNADGGRRRSGRQAAVADINVFRGAGLNVLTMNIVQGKGQGCTGQGPAAATESEESGIESSSDDAAPASSRRQSESESDGDESAAAAGGGGKRRRL